MIERGLAGARVEVRSDDDVHFEATVVSASLPASCRWPGIGWSMPRSVPTWVA